MRRGRLLLVAIGLIAGCESATPPTAAVPEAAAFDAGAADRLVAERRWSELFKLHADVRTNDDMKRSLDWSRDRLMAGGPVFIGLPYAVNLWRVASAAPPGSRLQELKDTSSVVGLYGFAVIVTDGNRCADATSPGERATEWITSFREPLRHAAGLPKDDRDKLVDTAVRMESRIAPWRQNDPWLCGTGMQRMSAALQAMKQSGDEPREVPTPRGGLGRTLLLPDPPGWTPSFIGPDEAAPREAAARQNLPTALHEFLDRIAAAQRS
jgi:hypothetical protein